MRFGTCIMEFDLVFSADNGTCKFCCGIELGMVFKNIYVCGLS